MVHRKLFLVSILILILVSCRQEKTVEYGNSLQEEDTLPSWARSATLYEVNTRHYTEEGTFQAFQTHLPRLRSLGVDILWLMPIHPISMKNRKATNDLMLEAIEDPEERKKYLGSPYAVADYRGVNPDLGSNANFKNLVDDVHAKGMRIIIDWVPNHTGWDNAWITEHPDWYTQDKDGNVIDPIDYNTGKSWGWTDVADLNYDNAEMRKAMIEAMQYWVDEFAIDGYRVDVAHGIPNDFWDQMKEELLTEERDLFMLAESEIPSHRNSGAFHATYGWSFHHLMNEVARGEKNADDVRKWLIRDRRKFKKGFHIHFTSNHDENAWAGTAFDRMGDAHKAMAVLAATIDGMPLIYSGQEEPLRRRLKFFEKDLIHFGDYEYADFYKTLFKFKESNRALWNGRYGGKIEHLTDHKNVLAFRREKSGDEVIVIINLSDEEQTYQLTIDVESRPDILTGSRKAYAAGEDIEIGPWRYYVLRE